MIPETFNLCTRPAKYKCRFVNPDDKDYWLVVWSIEDVKEKAREDDLELTDEEAQEILKHFQNHYDYVWETSWLVLEQSINHVLEEKEQEEEKAQ